jgi:hypothetical protein
MKIMTTCPGKGTTPSQKRRRTTSRPEENPTIGSFLCARSSDEDDGGDSDDVADGDDGSTSDDSARGDDSGDDDGDVGVVPPIKRRRFFRHLLVVVLASMYQADKSALGAIEFSFVMAPFFFMNDISFLILSKNRFTRSR